MSSKKCTVCVETKPLSEFYKNSKLSDGYLNQCKECVRNRVSNHRSENIDMIKKYDRNRPNHKERNENFKVYTKDLKTKNPKRWRKLLEYKRDYAKKYRRQKNATSKLKIEVEKGLILKPNYCCVCEEYFEDKSKLQGHHEDYNFPLSVIWLCIPCHANIHKIEKEKLRK